MFMTLLLGHGPGKTTDTDDTAGAPIFSGTGITAPDESDTKPPPLRERPMMNAMGIIGGCAPSSPNHLVELLRVREPIPATTHYSV